jgi:ATP-dependent Lon protease
MNPVFLLDEMDKVGNDWRGDPSSALLEVLDPAQNHTFRDHYLEFDLDLSEVVFIATANVIETIPAPLLDRTEIIRIDGYTDAEKVDIARDHLLPRQVRSAGLEPEEITVTGDALAPSWTDTRGRPESGISSASWASSPARSPPTVARSTDTTSAVTVDVDPDVVEYLGKPKVWKDEAKDRTDVPGVATGLAVTGAGGDVLFVEASVTGGERGLTLTGQLGDVMKESARIALSYIEANAERLGLARRPRRAHPSPRSGGGGPEGRPSAGVTMTTALVSLLTGRKVRAEVGMTGEVTLQGKVLPIGGVKQKVLAAHRAGLTEVVLPARNEVDLDDVPENVRER